MQEKRQNFRKSEIQMFNNISIYESVLLKYILQASIDRIYKDCNRNFDS